MVRRTVAAGFGYVLAAIVFTWPLTRHLRSLLGATDPAGDPSLNLWTLGWDLQTLSSHPGWWLNGRVFEASIFFPARHTLAYADHLLLQALVLWPVYALTHDLVLCYNVLLLGSLVATALAMHVLARRLTGSEAGAYVAGLIFGFAPYHFGHLTHIQLQALYFLPVSFFFLHRVFDADRRADAVALGVAMGLQAVSSIYYGVIGALGVACVGIVLAILMKRLGDWRLLRRGLLAAAVALLVMLPWSIPYLLVQREAGAGRNLAEAGRGGAVLASYLQAPPANLLYGRTEWLRPGPGARLPRKDGPEQALFPGFCALLLALAGVLWAPRGLEKSAMAYASLAVVGVVLSLGPDAVRPVYVVLYNALFGMAAIRAPARFSVLTLGAIAVLAALAIRALEIRRPRARPLVVVLVLAMAFEYSNGAIAFPPAPALSSNAGQWIAAQPDHGAVICVPMGVFTGNTPCMLQSLEHGRRIVNGYSGVRPPFFEALVDATSRIPSPESLQTLHDIGVEYVVSNEALAVDASLGEALVERAAFSDQHVYQVIWSPEIEARLAAAGGAPPPDPGPPVFVVGESATYRVGWTSGPLGIPAGEATIAVVPPQGAERFRFAVSAKTAPWVGRFYELDARLEASTDVRLLPIEYREAIAEGQRHTDRRLTFDFPRREVQIVSGGTSIALPLAAEARDPISALFFLRTLPMATGSRVSLPISDNGRRLRLDVDIGRPESIRLNGQDWPAWKLEPRLSARIERDALTMSAWISADARRIPLVVEVSAGFGTVRVELESYRER